MQALRKIGTRAPLFALLLGSGAVPAPVDAAEWRSTPMLTGAEMYTDNIFLSHVSQRRSDFVTEVTPALTVTGASRDYKVDVNYRLQNFLYANNRSRDRMAHQLEGNADVTWIRELLYTNARATVDQRVIDTNGPYALSNVSLVGNRTTVRTLHLNPFVRRVVNPWLETEAGYTVDRVSYTSHSTGDSWNNAVNFALGNVFTDARLTWQLNFHRQRLDYDVGPGSTFEKSYLDLRYLLGAKISAVATSGYENNDYQFTAQQFEPHGWFWSAGLNWSPTRRTSLEGRLGQRYFGDSGSFLFTHASRYSKWNVSYEKDIDTVSQLETSQQIFDLQGQRVGGLLDVFVVNTEVFVKERLAAGVTRELSKTTVGLDLVDERRDFQFTREHQEIQGAELTWDWRMTPFTALSVRSALRDITLESGARQDQLALVGLELRRRLGISTNGRLGYEYDDLDSNIPLFSYRVNMVSAAVDMTF